MILVGRAFRRLVALALLRHDVDEHGLVVRIAHVLEDGQQVVEVVPVDGADIVEAELLEQRAAHGEAFGELLRPRRAPCHELRQPADEALHRLAHRDVRLAGREAREIGTHSPDGRRDRHVVVVEDDDQPGVPSAGVVHCLVGHAGGHRSVADDRDHLVVGAGEVARGGKTEARRDRSRRMRRAERVVDALGPLGEAGKPAALTQGHHPVAPAGEDLVRVALVADVPDEDVVRRVEDVMERHRQLHHAER